MSNTPMTPTPEGKQLAADLTNGVTTERGQCSAWTAGDFGEDSQSESRLALARLATEHLALKEDRDLWKQSEAVACEQYDKLLGENTALKAEAGKAGGALVETTQRLREAEAAIAILKAEHEKALADLREIDRLIPYDPVYPSMRQAAAIAAKWRVETDPLDDLLWKALIAWESGDDPDYGKRIGTPEGLPAWDAAKAVFRVELSKRGFGIGGRS